ncbi:PucR family transcriptional regulator [Nocardioides ungokensis]|uniref:PucR family transcriptional regulator n=1 Tax=Nocardioides ungokensis TaxID=1643322 RepID=UPI0015DF732E|nr:PucR family transcriptional regulator [Nocardioides ungokensis]
MRAETLAFLAGHRRARLEALTDRLVATIEASNPGYRATRLVPHDDLWESCHDNIARVLELLAAAVAGSTPAAAAWPAGAEAGDAAYDAARATGHRRAEQGLPLDDVLRSFRIGGRLIWDDLVEQARSALDAEELREVGTRLWEVVDETSAQVAAAYHLAERAAVRADEQLRAELWEGVLSGRAKEPGFAHEAARILDVPVAGDYLVVLGDRLDAAGLEAALAPRPSVWVRRTGGVVGLVSLGGRAADGVLAVLRDRAEGTTAVSAVVAGLAGVDAGMRQASLALRTLDGEPGLAAFDDRLPEALVLTSPEVAGRLVAVWLGPLLALPPADRAPLIETLQAWVATGGSTTHTAARVHCHRNTVINRLRRVATLTGQDRFDGVPPLELGLALRALGAGAHR